MIRILTEAGAVTGKMNKIGGRPLFALILWLVLIFVTSCFVVPFDTFVRFIQNLSGDSVFKQWFAQFWLVSWLFVVKTWHATEYAILCVLCTITLQAITKWDYRRCVIVALLCAVAFAASDEWHQTFVPHRDGTVRDVLIDSVGAGFAAAVLWLRRKRDSESS